MDGKKRRSPSPNFRKNDSDSHGISKLKGFLRSKDTSDVPSHSNKGSGSPHQPIMSYELNSFPDKVFYNGVPIFLWCCGYFVVKDIQTEGLFRIPASITDRKALIEYAEQHDGFICYELLEEHGVNCACGVISLFIRSLPEPLLRFNDYDKWLDIAQRIEGSKKVDDSIIEEMRAIIRKLPLRYFVLLRWLIDLLEMISASSEKNHMDAKNLGIVFGPSLLKEKEESLGCIMNIGLCQSIVACMIKNNKKIFEGLPPEPALVMSTLENHFPMGRVPKSKRSVIDEAIQKKYTVWMTGAKPKLPSSQSTDSFIGNHTSRSSSPKPEQSDPEPILFYVPETEFGQLSLDDSDPEVNETDKSTGMTETKETIPVITIKEPPKTTEEKKKEEVKEEVKETTIGSNVIGGENELCFDLTYQSGFGCGLWIDDGNGQDNEITDRIDTLEAAVDALQEKELSESGEITL